MDLKPDIAPSVISKLQAIQDRICGNRIHVEKKIKRTPIKSVPTFRKDYVEWTSSDEEKYDVQRKNRPIRQAAAKRSIITLDSTDDSDYEPDSWYQLNESENKIKRGRGRPKKAKITEEKEIDESLLSLSKVLSRAELRKHNEKLEACDSDKPKIKRGRGRPRKIEESGVCTQTEGTSSTLSYCGSLDLEDGDFVQGIFELSEELTMEDVLKNSELSRISQEALASVYEEERNPETDAARLGLTFGDPDHYPLIPGPSTSSSSTPENSLPSTSGHQMTSPFTETLLKGFPSTSGYLPPSSDTSSHSQKTAHNTSLTVNIKPLLKKVLPSPATHPQKTVTTPSKTPTKYSKPPPPNAHSMRTRRNLSVTIIGPLELSNEVPKTVQCVHKEVPKEIIKRPKPALPSKIYVYPPIRKINSAKLNNNKPQTLTKKTLEASPGKPIIPIKTEIVVKEETPPDKIEPEDIPDSRVIPKEEIQDCEMSEISCTKNIPDHTKDLLELKAAIQPEELSDQVIKTEESSDLNMIPTSKPDRQVISTDDILSYCKYMSQEDLSDYDPPVKTTNRRTSAAKTVASAKEKMQVHLTNEKKMSKKEARTLSSEEQARISSTQLRTKNEIKIEPRTKDIKDEMSEAYEDVLDALIERSNSEEMYELNKQQSWKESLREKTENTTTVTSDQEDVIDVRTKVGNATSRRHSSKSNTSLDSVLTEFYGDLIATPSKNNGTKKSNESSSIFLASNLVSDTGGVTSNSGACNLPTFTSGNVSTNVVVEYDSSNFPNTSVTTKSIDTLQEYAHTLPNQIENMSQEVSPLVRKINSCFSTTSATSKSIENSVILASEFVSDSVTTTDDGSKELDKTSTNSSITHEEIIPHTTVPSKTVQSADNNNSINQKNARGGYRLTSYPPLTPPPTPGKQTSQIIPRKFQVTPDKWFTCDKCGTIFKFLSTYQYHMKMDCNIKGAVQGKPPEQVDGTLPLTKGGKGAFQCPQCPKVVATRTSLMVNE